MVAVVLNGAPCQIDGSQFQTKICDMVESLVHALSMDLKQHIAVDLESKLILATCLRPANEPEHKASTLLKPKVLNYGSVSELKY